MFIRHRISRSLGSAKFSIPVGLVLVVLAWGVGCSNRSSTHPLGTAGSSSTNATYVGDDACGSCHEALANSFERTGMGRSLSVFDPANAPEVFSSDLVVKDPNSLYSYTAFVRNDTLFQREWLEDHAGTIVNELTMPVEWVVGSGNATRSYLINVNGFVTEAPLTWYVNQKKWDMSPGYSQKNQRFSRPINLECMTCHNSIPEFTPFTVNHYTDVPLGISCERCHGPSSIHVERQLAGLEVSSAEIVNPARLDRELQLAVCQQCHLTGLTAFEPGQDATTFRPGNLLSSNRAVFEEQDETATENSFGIASHASRLALSECFIESAMTCTTCHDPHVPVSETITGSYSATCQSCHQASPQTLCARPVQIESDRVTGDCVSCHMQKGGTSDIPHVAFTDHWIRSELPDSAPVDADDIDRLRTSPMSLVRISKPAAGAPLGRDELEQAIGYFELYETIHKHPGYLPRIESLAEQGLAAGEDDPNARLALGRSFIERGEFGKAVRELADAVERYPEHALLWYWLGSARSDAGDAAGALAALNRAIEIQPLSVDAIAKRASLLATLGRIDEAIADFTRVLDLDPVNHPKSWNNQGLLLLQTGQTDDAIESLETAVRLDPLMVEARLNLGSAYLVQGDNARAKPQFERVLATDPTSIAAMGNLGIVHTRDGDYAAARSLFLRILEVSPNDANARRLLSDLDNMIQSER